MIMLSVSLVAYLHIRTSCKAAIVACFAPRSLVVAASLIRLIWLYPITPHSNPEFQLWLPPILMQAHASLSICTACIPYMVPFFKTLEGSLRRKNSARESDSRLKQKNSDARPSTLWFRRHAKPKAFDSWGSASIVSTHYERVPTASPYIPAPRALSPLTPTLYTSRPNTAGSRSSGTQGLCISIPARKSSVRQVAVAISPRIESSSTLSPSCTSGLPVFPLGSYTPSRKALTPPVKAHSPNPTSSSNYSSRQSSPISPIRPARFSLFPHQSTPGSRYSPELRHGGLTPVSIPPIRALRPQISAGIARHPTVSGSCTSTDNSRRMRSASAAQPPKFSTAPQPTSPPSTTTSPASKQKHVSAQDLTSPMGAAIDHYFDSAWPEVAPTPPAPAAALMSPHQRRNLQVLSPSNTLRIYGVSHTSPPDSPLPFLQPHVMVVKTSLRAQTMPTVRDARSSPQIVVRERS